LSSVRVPAVSVVVLVGFSALSTSGVLTYLLPDVDGLVHECEWKQPLHPTNNDNQDTNDVDSTSNTQS